MQPLIWIHFKRSNNNLRILGGRNTKRIFVLTNIHDIEAQIMRAKCMEFESQ